MKRLTASILSLSLLLSLAACGGGAGSPAPSAEGTPVPSEAASLPAEIAPAESPVPTPEPEPSEAPETAPTILPAAPSAPAPAVVEAAAPASAAPVPQPEESPSAQTPETAQPEESPSVQTPETAQPEESDDPDAVPMPTFTTKDLQGNLVTRDIFTGADLTVVNIWGTYCGPCINEMPQLAAWAKEMPDNVQLIGIVCDLAMDGDASTLELALRILDNAGADFTCLTVSQDLAPVLYGVVGVPTTFFVDGRGNIVGQAILGAYVDQYKAQVEVLLHGEE